MPFTFSHPAIILPFNRLKFLSITGLVAGSLAPDFEYFIRMNDTRVYTHTWSGLLWFDIPLALLLAFIFHNIVRHHIIHNTPFSLQKRLQRYESFNWNANFKKHWFTIGISALVGVVSHLLWDNFTHENGYFVLSIPFLASTINISGFLIEVHMILQVLSSLLGCATIIYALWQLPIDQKATINFSPFTFWIIVFSISILIYIIRIYFGVSHEVEDYIIPAISAILFGTIITSLLIKYRFISIKPYNKL